MDRRIDLAPPNPEWQKQFALEAINLREVLTDNCCNIEHIGSTAIPGCYAKPVIDLLITVRDLSGIDALNPLFKTLGYECEGEFGIKGRRFYWKSKIQRTHHIHLFEEGHPEVKRHLAFRDYLRNHTAEAQAYSWIKRCLAEQFPTDIAAYINGKDSFVRAMDYEAGTAKQDQLNATDQIILEPYNPNWPKLANAEINAIKQVIELPYVAIEHLGSTAIEGLSAKPTLDIFIALESMDDIDHWTQPLKSLGYIDWPDNPNKAHARFFKGMPPFGLHRTHHLHIMATGDRFKERVLFRDTLRQDENLRGQYQQLKQDLAERYKDDREAYTEAKKAFILQVIR